MARDSSAALHRDRSAYTRARCGAGGAGHDDTELQHASAYRRPGADLRQRACVRLGRARHDDVYHGRCAIGIVGPAMLGAIRDRQQRTTA